MSPEIAIFLTRYFCRLLIFCAQNVGRSNMDKYKKETLMMARNRSLHKRLMAFAPPHHYPAYVATTVERDENGAYLKIPLISPLAAAYKHQACKYCSSFEVGSTHPSCCCLFSKRLPLAHVLIPSSYFPLAVSNQEDVRERKRLLARWKQEVIRQKNFHVHTFIEPLPQSFYAYLVPPTRLPSPFPSRWRNRCYC